MDVVTRRPPAPPEDLVRSDDRRHRRWPWVVVPLAVLATLLVAATTVWVANVEPLGPGSSLLGPHGVRFSAPSPGPTVSSLDVDAFGVNGMVLEIPARPEMRFTYLATIRNDGPVPVRIVAIGTDPGPGPIGREVVAFEDDHPGGMPEHLASFRPFTLDPGAQAAIQMEVTVTGLTCYSPGTSTAWSWEPVTYEVFGLAPFTRHADVRTGTEIRLVGNDHTDC